MCRLCSETSGLKVTVVFYAVPGKKVAVVASLVNSPTTRQPLQRLGYVNTPEDEEEVHLASSILEDASEALQMKEVF